MIRAKSRLDSIVACSSVPTFYCFHSCNQHTTDGVSQIFIWARQSLVGDLNRLGGFSIHLPQRSSGPAGHWLSLSASHSSRSHDLWLCRPRSKKIFVTCQKRDRKQLLGNFSKCVANVLHGIFMLFPESNCTTTDSIGIRSTVDCSHSIASILHRLLVIARYPSVPRHHHCALANQSC